MAKVIGVRYKKAGRIYSFDPAGLELAVGDKVVVDTARGPELGEVVYAAAEIADEELELPLKSVLHIAQAEDCNCSCARRQKEKQIILECIQVVSQLGLPMKLLQAEYNLDESYITVYFSAAGRVDFRELVRELGRRLKVRVELRQVGPRDETKLLGGYGRCGRELCCACYLTEFEPVSIKMAKEQNLPLNPTKISGACGRLLCCLGYEYEMYRDMHREKALETPPAAPETKEREAQPSSASSIKPVIALVADVAKPDETTEAIPVALPHPRPRRRRRR